MTRQPPAPYWSSCCGQPAEYIGCYRCTGCKSQLNLARSQPPYITGNPAEAVRIREQGAAPPVPEGCLL